MCICIPSTLDAVGTPGGFVLGLRTTHSTATELEAAVRGRLVDEDLRHERVDRVVGRQRPVDVGIAHRTAVGCETQPVMILMPGDIHPSELVARRERPVEVVEVGRHPPHLYEQLVCRPAELVPASTKTRPRGSNARTSLPCYEPDPGVALVPGPWPDTREVVQTPPLWPSRTLFHHGQETASSSTRVMGGSLLGETNTA